MATSYLDGLFSVAIAANGATIPDVTGVNFSGDFLATRNAATKLVDVSLSTSSGVGAYVRATGSVGTAGLTVGRYDLDASGGIPGAWGVKDDDGGGFSLKVDNGAALTSSAWSIQVASGAMLLSVGLDLPVGSAPSVPAASTRRLYAIGNILSVKDHDATVRRVDCWRVRFVVFADSPVTALDGDIVFADTTGGGISVVVPNGSGASVKIYRIAGATAITASASSGTIHGAATLAVSNSGVETRGDGTNVWT